MRDQIYGAAQVWSRSHLCGPLPPVVSRLCALRCPARPLLTLLIVRRGPDGPSTLCNRCGLRWRKEQLEKEAKEIGEHVQLEQEDSSGEQKAAVGITEA